MPAPISISGPVSRIPENGYFAEPVSQIRFHLGRAVISATEINRKIGDLNLIDGCCDAAA